MKTFTLHHVEYTLESTDHKEMKALLTNNINEDLLEVDISPLYGRAISLFTTSDGEEGIQYDGDLVREYVGDYLENFISDNIGKGLVIHP